MSVTDDALAALAGAQWRKSSHSSATNCVEVARTSVAVCLRDSKDRGGPVLLFSRDAWRDFVHSVQNGEFSGGTPVA